MLFREIIAALSCFSNGVADFSKKFKVTRTGFNKSKKQKMSDIKDS